MTCASRWGVIQSAFTPTLQAHSPQGGSLVTHLLMVLLLTGCNRSFPVGQFGPYSQRNAHFALNSNETLAVYRVKYWTFSDRSEPALQLEFEPPFLVSDTAAVRREAIRLWPKFGPYVKGMGLGAAIITATNLRVSGIWPFAWTSRVTSYGLVIQEGPLGHWRFRQDTTDLPTMDTTGVLAILDSLGTPMPHRLPIPEDSIHPSAPQ